MFEQRREKQRKDRVNALQRLPLLGDSIQLLTGATVQKPNPQLIDAIKAIDPRLRYYPINKSAAEKSHLGYEYFRGVTDFLGQQVRTDFPVTDLRLALRGTVLSLRDRFQHFDLTEAQHDVSRWRFAVDPENHRAMNDVLTTLRTGSERKVFLTSHFDGIGKGDELGGRASEWLFQHTLFEIEQCLYGENAGFANNLFPSLLVYDADRMDIEVGGRIKDPNGLVAVYVTDRVLYENHIRKLGSAIL